MRHPIDLRRVLYALRLAGPSDRDSILRFQRAAIAAIDPGIYSSRARAAWWRQPAPGLDALLSELRYVVATHRGQPVAGAGWCPAPDRPETAALRAVFVDPSHAGQGLGRKLVALAEDMAVTAGYAQLLVRAALNSVGFYRSLGYDPGEEAVLELEDGTPLPYLVMWKHALLMRAPG